MICGYDVVHSLKKAIWAWCRARKMPDGAGQSGCLFYAEEYTNSSKAGAGGSLMNFRQDYGGNAKNIERISISIALCIRRLQSNSLLWRTINQLQ